MAKQNHFLIHLSSTKVRLSKLTPQGHAMLCRYGLDDKYFKTEMSIGYSSFDDLSGIGYFYYKEAVRLFYQNNVFHFQQPAALLRLQQTLPKHLFNEMSSIVMHTGEFGPEDCLYPGSAALKSCRCGYDSWKRAVQRISELPKLQSLDLDFGPEQLCHHDLVSILKDLRSIIKIPDVKAGAYQIHYTCALPGSPTPSLLASMHTSISKRHLLEAGQATDWALYARIRGGLGPEPEFFFHRHNTLSVCLLRKDLNPEDQEFQFLGFLNGGLGREPQMLEDEDLIDWDDSDDNDDTVVYDNDDEDENDIGPSFYENDDRLESVAAFVDPTEALRESEV
ncbi:hypothetical protein K461DRAFT_290451 [Myriangium duriaei CBS 260.36]|uniref:Uncharacterized protein n=1 Tax=Myriangium duriaei CBS 260.36 TaxID=1168546 RepID=A0A9P4MQD7_9PEZI|nr:hypothetical protein K461DRAFT_290451 [Myriangium duriaei CBS 260.36]